MRVERALSGRHKSLRQRIEGPVGSEPGKMVAEVFHRRGKLFFECAPHERIEPVGSDYKVCIQLVER